MGSVVTVWGTVFRNPAHRKKSRIEEGHLMVDHVTMVIAPPPKYAVSQVPEALDAPRRLCDPVDLASDHRKVALSNLGEDDLATGLSDQRCAEADLQGLDLLADRALGLRRAPPPPASCRPLGRRRCKQCP